MNRYYDTKLRCEVFEENENTLTNEDERVSFFFDELPKDKELKFNDEGIPLLIDYISVSKEFIDTQNKVSEANQFLQSTDWYYLRQLETGEEVPEEVLAKRGEARKLINTLKAELGVL